MLPKQLHGECLELIDTMIIGWLHNREFMTGLKIGGIEVITKMILYYFHERMWFKINLGLPHRKSIKSKENNLNNLKHQSYQIDRQHMKNGIVIVALHFGLQDYLARANQHLANGLHQKLFEIWYALHCFGWRQYKTWYK